MLNPDEFSKALGACCTATTALVECYKTLLVSAGFTDTVRAVTNQYCSCCGPWVETYAPVGTLVIGHRNRVFHIEWSAAINFPQSLKAEYVTMGERSIHAWTIEDALRYLKVIHAALLKEQEHATA